MFKLASLVVELVAQSDSLDRALSRTHANLTTANVALGTFAGNVAATFGRMAVGAAGGLFEGTVRSASHLAETMNKVQVVLGDSSSKIIANADDMANRFGLVRKEIIDAGSSFALLGKEMGMTGDESADFGVKLTKMAADATSLSDIPMDRMLEKLRSGLAGQVRPLRELGIFMTADAVKAEAARMGLKPGASGQLSEGDKIRARVSFIENSEFMKKASGDLARTLGETENQTRKFWGTLSNLGTSIGEQLNPAWEKLLQDFNSGLDSLKGYFEANKGMVKGWGDSVVEGFETAKVVWRNLPDVFEIALLSADQKMEDARARIETWATTTAVTVESAFLKAAQSVGNFFQGMQSGVQAAAAQQVGGLEGVVSGLRGKFEALSKWWDEGISRDAKRADFLLRPLRDLNNLIERQEGVTEGHDQSVEDRVNRLQGVLSGPSSTLGGIGEFLKTLKSSFTIGAEGKPKDFTSSLIDKANKHLADTLGENTDISSKAIAAAQAKIMKREAERLADETTKRNDKYLDDEYAKMFPDAKKPATRPGKAGGGGGAVEEVAAKHEKMLTDTASFAMKLQAGQLGGDVQERQLTELQQIRAANQKNADMMEKMYNRMARAAYA